MSQWDSKTAEWYAEKYGDYATNRLGIEALQFAPDHTIVDIGCGTGSALRHAAQYVTDGKLIGIDPIARMVEIAQMQTASHSAADRIVYHQSGAESLPVEDASADYVLAFDSFDHWQDQLQGLQEVRRILKPDGSFVVVKDGGLPNGAEARRLFMDKLLTAGFTVVSEQTITDEDIVFMQWVCQVSMV